MLLALRIRGFKNLRDVSVRLGPMTCFVGPNGVGKSNILDAILFLKYLADLEIREAADRIRRPAEGAFSPLDLFWNRDGSGRLEFDADLLLPRETTDDFGVTARSTTTLVKYRLALGWNEPERRLELLEESLRHHKKSESSSIIGFPHSKTFRDSVVHGKRHVEAGYISTKRGTKIELHQDGGSRGRPIAPGKSPRTVLGGTNTADYPTVLSARREMASWCLLQLEPSSLRAPDRLGDTAPIDELGRHVAATLERIAKQSGDRDRTLLHATHQVRKLVSNITGLRVTQDPARDQLFLEARFGRADYWLPPRALSEGTLRFIAMTVMQMDSVSASVLCIEEPENGMHPFVIHNVVDLLHDYAVDPTEPEDRSDNPLRQVVANSHSPVLTQYLDMEEVLFVESVESSEGTEAVVRSIECERNWRGGRDVVTPHRFHEIVGCMPRGQPNLDFVAEE